MKRFRLRRPDDFHTHQRLEPMLGYVVLYIARVFGRWIVMPNTNPDRGIANGMDVLHYLQSITQHLPAELVAKSRPLMTLKINQDTMTDEVDSAADAGAVAGKGYMEGMTTLSNTGIRNIPALYPILERMQERGLKFLWHGEKPGVFCMDREAYFLDDLSQVALDFPDLRQVMEHLSTELAVERILELPANVAATITLHHLELTLDDVVGGMIDTHHFCKPLAKRPEDREALRQAAFSGNPKFFFGSDSAPHLRENKECAHGCAGVFSAPVLMPALVELFEKAGKLEMLEGFTSVFGAQFYGLPLNEGSIQLVQKPWQVSAEYHGIVPYKAGETLEWSMVDEE